MKYINQLIIQHKMNLNIISLPLQIKDIYDDYYNTTKSNKELETYKSSSNVNLFLLSNASVEGAVS